MNKLIPYFELVHYDGPQVFLSKDEVGTKYLCVKLRSDGNGLYYIAAAISDYRLTTLLNGTIDLRYAMIHAERGEWYIVDDGEDNLDIVARRIDVDEAVLPNPGFNFHPEEFKHFDVLSEAASLKKTVVHLILSQDDNDDHTIDSDALADILKLYQAIVKNVLKKTAANKYIDKAFVAPANYRLRAAAYSPGSFKLHLVSSSDKDLFGNNVIDQVLERMDQLMDNNTSSEHVISNFKPYAGHTVSAYRKLLTKLVDMNINMRYVWATPLQQKAHETRIPFKYAEHVRDILISRNDLNTEMKELIGIVEEADGPNGSWRIRNSEDGKTYRGTSEVSLADIQIMSRYRFTCEEKMEELAVSNKEVASYTLKKYQKL